jgi:tryptophan synthase alpha chain
MNRLTRLFQNKQQNVLSVYFTAGYPKLNDTVPVLQALDKAGADIAEIGMPFSDPVADGTVIQLSNQQSLNNGMSLSVLFDQLRGFRAKVHLPVVLMGYFNPVFQMGVEKFCQTCNDCGVDGVILPDLPPAEYLEKYKAIFEAHHISMIFLISPQTSEERIRYIDSISTSFIYAVSSYATTGQNKGFEPAQIEYFKKLQALKLEHPFLIGFGIHDAKTFADAAKYSAGAIIGSGFIRHLQKDFDEIDNHIESYVKAIR